MGVFLTRRGFAVTILMSSLASLLGPSPAQAELVFFANGRTLSVRSHRVDGNLLVLSLRAGGEITCDRAVIARIEPDEIPYPEPETSPGPGQSMSAPYDEIIEKAAAKHGVPPGLVKAVIQVESGYQERARSRKGAMGLMQLMPETARMYDVVDPYEPRSNIEAGVKHLKLLLDRFQLPLALAAYNAGEAAVRRFGGLPPYPETRNYVSRIMGLLAK
jgi:soluble lytic murein transglycosylase-like protein